MKFWFLCTVNGTWVGTDPVRQEHFLFLILVSCDISELRWLPFGLADSKQIIGAILLFPDTSIHRFLPSSD